LINHSCAPNCRAEIMRGCIWIVARTDELAQIHDPRFKHLKASEYCMALEGQAVGDLTSKSKSPS
jgi:hypothetical protein